MIQAPSPSPDNRWYHQQGFSGARKTIQLHLVEPESVSDTVFSLAA